MLYRFPHSLRCGLSSYAASRLRFGFDERGVSEFAKLPVPMITRRKFLTRSAFAAGCALSLPRFLQGASGPSLQFPSQPRERIAIASYPFRDFVVGIDDKTPGSK